MEIYAKMHATKQSCASSIVLSHFPFFFRQSLQVQNTIDVGFFHKIKKTLSWQLMRGLYSLKWMTKEKERGQEYGLHGNICEDRRLTCYKESWQTMSFSSLITILRKNCITTLFPSRFSCTYRYDDIKTCTLPKKETVEDKNVIKTYANTQISLDFFPSNLTTFAYSVGCSFAIHSILFCRVIRNAHRPYDQNVRWTSLDSLMAYATSLAGSKLLCRHQLFMDK